MEGGLSVTLMEGAVGFCFVLLCLLCFSVRGKQENITGIK